MWNDSYLSIVSLYGMESPDPKHMKERMKRVAKVIASMGDKYLLATSIPKKTKK